MNDKVEEKNPTKGSVVGREGYDPDDNKGELDFPRYTQHVAHG
jgi:hypothetical protein